MARGARPLIRPLTALGIAAAVLVAALVAGTVIAVLLRAGGAGGLTAADWGAVRFTLLQAALSAGLSVALAVPVARALARRRFVGRGLLVTLLGAPFILPVIVAVLGLLAVFGRSGWVSDALGLVGLPPLRIYGLTGVVLAHVFFNLPLAVRLVLQGWLAIPAERFRLAAALGFSRADTFRVLELPMLRAVLPGAALVIFLICTTSFAVALTLGGGPAATTVELAIYQAFRFDFDPGRAAVLALLQLAITGLAALAALRLALPVQAEGGLDRPPLIWTRGGRLADAGWIFAAALFLLAPLSALLLGGAPGFLTLPGTVWSAAGRSILVALGSAGATLLLAVPLAIAAVRLRGIPGRLVEIAGTLGIAASPLVLGTGLFVMIWPWADPTRLTLPVTGLVNAIMALPFALRALVPAVAEIEARFGRLADSLGLLGWSRLRRLLLPRLRRPLGFAAGLAAALSMGDLGVVALFADADSATLPLQMYRLMGAYRMEQAASAALLLLALSLGLYWICDRGGRVDADA